MEFVQKRIPPAAAPAKKKSRLAGGFVERGGVRRAPGLRRWPSFRNRGRHELRPRPDDARRPGLA